MKKTTRTPGAVPAITQLTEAAESFEVFNYDERRAAAFLGCTVACLRRWRLTGDGPVYSKIGRLVRYPRQSLVEFVNKNMVTSTTGSTGA